MNEEIKFCTVRKVKDPTRGTSRSAGIDLYVPEDLTQAQLDKCQPIKQEIRALVEGKNGLVKQLQLFPQQRILIPSGVKCNIPKGYAGVIMNKSGVSSKTGLCKLAELIDEDYQGEIHINVVNTGNEVVKIVPGEKIAQMVLIPVMIAPLKKMGSVEELFSEGETERGVGGFGSTDKTKSEKPKKKPGRPSKKQK